jgi:class 3 adenylate cyclase
LQIRIGVHVGEVELTANGVRGLAVHEAARVTALAGAGEIFVSEATRTLAGGTDRLFHDRGEHELKGLDGRRRVYSYAPQS